jgi:hypothetical protein
LVRVASVTGTMGRRRVSEQRPRRERTALMGAGLGSMKWAFMRARVRRIEGARFMSVSIIGDGLRAEDSSGLLGDGFA